METPAIATSPPLRLTLAVATLAHGALLLMGSFQKTYDAYVHMFFANHYAQDWFSTWDTRWYTGFTVTSYPPGSHQLMALLSHCHRARTCLRRVQMASVLILAIGVKRFSRIWVSESAANWAASVVGAVDIDRRGGSRVRSAADHFLAGLLAQRAPVHQSLARRGSSPVVVGWAVNRGRNDWRTSRDRSVWIGVLPGPDRCQSAAGPSPDTRRGEVEGHYRS